MVTLSKRIRRVTAGVALLFLSFGIVGALFARNLIEFFLMAELITVSGFHFLFAILVPIIYPRKRDAEEIFLGGAAKPPYIHEYEIFVPEQDLIAEEEMA